MSFASDTKQELCEIEDKPCCALAELAALVHGAGTLRIGRGGPSVVMTTEAPRVARRIFSLCKESFGFTPELRTQMRKRLGRRNTYQVVLPPERAGEVLVRTGLLFKSGEGLRSCASAAASTHTFAARSWRRARSRTPARGITWRSSPRRRNTPSPSRA